MPRLSDYALKEKSVNELEYYAQMHPKEALRVATILGESSAKVAFGVIRRKIPNCSSITATYCYTTK